jgi:flavin-dependent dehydrogenase
MNRCDVIVIGAGPAGTVAAKILHDAGLSVTVVEAQPFPRFVIGESLLPNCMAILERCGMAQAVENAGFQLKTGAVFVRGDQHQVIDFRENFEENTWGTTFQVQRARFDAVLATEAQRAGVPIHFETTVTQAKVQPGECSVTCRDADGMESVIQASFIVDASGYGRVLPQMLGLVRPPALADRRALFTHLKDRVSDPDYDREKILITVHPERHDIWYWMIPFSDGTSSVGVVYPDGDPAYGPAAGDTDDQQIFTRLLGETALGTLLSQATPVRPLGSLVGYSAQSEALYGPGYALLGNSAGFLDPIFSSGVTIALYSAELAAAALIRQFKGESVDWAQDYAAPLTIGVETFRSCVESWYKGPLQEIIFNQPKDDNPLKRMVVSILAGYAWNPKNRLVTQTDRYLTMLYDLCA